MRKTYLTAAISVLGLVLTQPGAGEGYSTTIPAQAAGSGSAGGASEGDKSPSSQTGTHSERPLDGAIILPSDRRTDRRSGMTATEPSSSDRSSSGSSNSSSSTSQRSYGGWSSGDRSKERQ